MVQLEIAPTQIKALAQEERERIEESLARSGADSAAFWHAVALIYRRGLPTLRQVDSWLLVHAAARLSEGIQAEHPMLISRLDRAQRQAAH